MEVLVIDRYGYKLLHHHKFPSDYIDQVLTELTVEPKENGYARTKRFALYSYNKSRDIIMPKFYGLETFGKPVIKYSLQPQINYNFLLKLRQNQVAPVKSILNAFNENGGGIVCAPCGMGKTLMSIYCIYKLKCRALVIVNRVELVNQWKNEIAKAMGNSVEVGEIRGDIIDYNKPIVIGMVNTISMKKLEPRIFHGFDLLIVDECHNVASEIFHLCLPKIRTPYTLGLSASPFRKDGLFKVVEWFLGPLIYKDDRKLNSTLEVLVNLIKYDVEDKYSAEIVLANDKPNVSQMLNNIAVNPIRNELIIQMVKMVLGANSPLERRKILILSDRKNQLKYLIKALDKLEISCGLYVGNMKTEEYAVSKTKDVLLGTYSICGTGFDLPDLNTLILATPRSNVLQMVGRILRKQHLINPLIIDILDNFSIFKFEGNARKKYYNSNDIYINEIEINKDSNPELELLLSK